MFVSDFAYELPEELIAQQPAARRDASRLLTLDRASGVWADCRFGQIVGLLREGDVLVVNDSRVIPARLSGRRAQGGRVEVLLTEALDGSTWKALVKPGKKVRVGDRIRFEDRLKAEAGQLQAEVVEHGDYGERTLRFTGYEGSLYEALYDYGTIPLPPYIHRERGADDAADRERYQTVYANEHGSVAVPTAGLHFTPEILKAIRERGVTLCSVTLHVGLGTFQPLRVDRVEDIRLHREHYTLPAETAALINRAKQEGRRVVAVGTTTVRTLEHCAGIDEDLKGHSGFTEIFISPGYRFRIVDALLTNFHLPQSSLLMLVAAFAGTTRVLAAYRHAVAAQYRFFSYGDCMFIS